MGGKFIRFAIVLVAALLAASFAFAGGKSKRAQQKQIAVKIVENVAGVKAKDLVIISGKARDMDLLEDLALEVIKKGAHQLRFSGRETFSTRYFDEIPAERDSDPPAWSLKLTELADVKIIVQGEENPSRFKKVPIERMIAARKAHRPVYELEHKRGVRRVFLGNGLYPTRATARQYGLSKRQLEKIFWAGLNVDYQKLQETGAKLRGILEAGKQVHITNKNGTDIKFGIEKRPIMVSDGVISEEDVKKGGAATLVWLPAGEVMVAPVPGSAEGKVVFDRFPIEDSAVFKMTMTFVKGKMASVTAKKNAGFKRWKDIHDTCKDAGKDDFSWVNFGINPNVKIPKKSKLVTWMPAGMVSCGIGGNDYMGGDNTATYGAGGFIPGSTVKVDDKVIIENGKLKI